MAKSRYDGWMNTAVLAVFPLIIAVALALSLPRFIEGLLVLPGDAALEVLYGRVGTVETLDSLINSREWAVGLIDRGKYRSDLSMALVLKSTTLPLNQRREILDRAVTEAEAAVTSAPSDAHAWHRLAQASFKRDGISEKVVNEELSSIAVGPYLTDLLVPRLDILFASRSFLDQKYDDIIDDQIRVATKRVPSDVVRAARRNGTADIVRRALAREPSMLNDGFDGWMSDPNIR